MLLNINRAATFVCWSPFENKFAVASGGKYGLRFFYSGSTLTGCYQAIVICSFYEESDWWVSKLKKPIRSTILSINWHPNNVLLAAGCADMKARVFPACIKDADKKQVLFPHSWCYNRLTVASFRPAPIFWGEKLPFGTVCGELASPAGGWVHTVSFSPSGDVLAFTSKPILLLSMHAALKVLPKVTTAPSASYILDLDQRSAPLGMTTLPPVTLVWTSEGSIVAAGHDCQPYVFSGNENGWRLIGVLTTRPLRNLLSLLPGLARLDLGG